jgi:hypothetical protein
MSDEVFDCSDYGGGPSFVSCDDLPRRVWTTP